MKMGLVGIVARSGLPLGIAQLSKTALHAKAGDPSRIRTCNPRSRNPLLYPVELWDRWGLFSTANMKNPLPRQAGSEPKSRVLRPSRAGDRYVRSAAYAGRPRGTGTSFGNAACD